MVKGIMRYSLCDIDKARSAGIVLNGKLKTKDDKVMLNESSLMNCNSLVGTFEERSEALGGKTLTDAQAQVYVRENNLTINNII